MHHFLHSAYHIKGKYVIKFFLELPVVSAFYGLIQLERNEMPSGLSINFQNISVPHYVVWFQAEDVLFVKCECSLLIFNFSNEWHE
jgi:hypothetical protein